MVLNMVLNVVLNMVLNSTSFKINIVNIFRFENEKLVQNTAKVL